ncbi:hypothetical protein GE061_015632 [Apolygus lucorum]|uniref:PLAT domain-containing protein n=1 Tax=Apolygus lucorum TaxID=248454 RepID=A0A8S9XMN6_APOLU|nr:hypothetical protein GE061_015632 [Apolygus lucorum]
MLRWLWLRDGASNCLLKVVSALHHQSKKHGYKRLLHKYPFGDILDRFMFTFSLAHAQGIESYETFVNKNFVSYLMANEILFSATRNKKLFEHVALLAAETVSNYAVLYSGVITYGNETVKIWSANDSYVGLMYFIDKTETGELKFFTYEKKSSSERWYDRINLQLPEPPFRLQFKELTLTAVAMKNRELDPYQSPILILSLKSKNGPVNFLPGEEPYLITLPAMEKGKLLNESGRKEKFRDVIEHRAPEDQHYHAYKLTFPKRYNRFDLAIHLVAPLNLKVKARLDRIPDYDEVLESPVQDKFHHDTIENVYVFTINITPHDGETSLPKDVYLGILPADDFPIGIKLDIYMFTDVRGCRTRDIFTDEEIGDCQTVVNHTESNDINTVCRCTLLGITTVHGLKLGIARYIISNVPLLETFTPPAILLEALIGTAFFAILPIVALILAYISDRKHRRKEILIYPNDFFRRDTHEYIIGVYTGHRVGSGTVSTAAVQLQGQKGLSRVILLKPTSPANSDTLHRGKDDWFLLTSEDHLGSITAIYMWHNYHCSSPWYCSQILIYDATTHQWFRAPVKRWFRISDPINISRVAMVRVNEYVIEENFEFHNFLDGLIVEFENTHHTFSICEMHRRVLYTHEQRTTIFVLKFIIMFCWICLFQEVLFEIIFNICEYTT